MPGELDEIEDMDAGSSAVSALDDTTEAGKAEGEDAGSSTATDETKVDSLSVVRDVVDKREKGETAAASSAEGEEAGEQNAGGRQSKAQDDENFSDVPFHEHPRFQHLIRQRNSYREDAGRYRNVQDYLEQQGLTAEEAADGLEIMGLMKLDPAKAWEKLKPRVQALLVAAGEVLPDDLNQRVQKNEMSREAALEVSRARAALQTQKARQDFDAQRSQRTATAEAGRAITSTVDAWEADRRMKDPNFDAKLPRIQEKIAFLHKTEGVPKDVEGVRAQLKKVYDAVNKEFTPAQPSRPQQRKPAVSMVRGGQVAGNARPEPKTTLDIVRANRRSA